MAAVNPVPPNNPNPQPPSPAGGPGWWVAIFLIVFFVGGMFLAIALDAPALTRLSDPSYARGLITWLIILTTIGIAFIMIYQAFNNTQQSEEGFRRGREVFAGLMGIVGTIVGFYFGSTNDVASSSSLAIADIIYSENQLTTYVIGGRPPYRFTVESDPKGLVLDPKKVEVAQTGWIIYKLAKVPSEAATLTMTVVDAKEVKATKKVEIKPTKTPAVPQSSGSGESVPKTENAENAAQEQK